MRSVDSATSTFVLSRKPSVIREAIWLTVKDRDTNAPVHVGFWTDIDTVSITVKSGETGGSVTRDYNGAGGLMTIGAIPLSSDLSVQTVPVTLSGINEAVALAVRGYEARQGYIDIHRIPLDPDTMHVIGVPPSHFFGRINHLDMPTPAAGGEWEIAADCVSHIRELTRINGAKRSDETQRLRSGDRFRRFSGTAYQSPIYWGENRK